MKSKTAVARDALRDAIRDDLVAYVERLNERGCPPVSAVKVRDLLAHSGVFGAPDLDEHAAKVIRVVLDLGWRPTT